MEYKKNFWCPVCKDYPDKIIGVFDTAVEHRFWQNDDYELDDISYGACARKCDVCGTNLEDKPQEEDNDALSEL